MLPSFVSHDPGGKTNSQSPSPENRPKRTKRKGASPKHHVFRGELLVSGSVAATTAR